MTMPSKATKSPRMKAGASCLRACSAFAFHSLASICHAVAAMIASSRSLSSVLFFIGAPGRLMLLK